MKTLYYRPLERYYFELRQLCSEFINPLLMSQISIHLPDMYLYLLLHKP